MINNLIISINEDTYFRNFSEFGYLYNKITKKELIIDQTGSYFVSHIYRTKKSLNQVVKTIAEAFEDTPIKIINKDFLDLINKLVNYGFIYLEESLDKRVKKADKFSQIEEFTNQSASSYMKNYFQTTPTPFYSHLEITKACNLNCIHCFWPSHNNIYLSKESIFNLLNDLSQMGCLYLYISGGEAFLHPNFIEILQYANSLDFCITIMTNGTLIDQSIINELKKIKIDHIQISVYSIDETIHDQITESKGSLKKTLDAIDLLKSNGIEVQIASPILKENKDSVTKVSNYFKNKYNIFVDHDYKIAARKDFSKDNLKHRIKIDDFKYLVEKDNIIDVNPIENRLNNICGASIEMICISPDGTVSPCANFDYAVGNINDSSINHIWNNSSKLLNFRNITINNFIKCKNCEYLQFCKICPALNYNESNGDIFYINDYFCKMSKIIKNEYCRNYHK